MCGIAGFLNFHSRPADQEILCDMLDLLKHRGPDDRGVYIDQNLGLAHTRLSIIDVACGHQPMQSAEGSLVITFNGEIFNYVELREKLRRKGHRFATSSDTEVLLQLYEEEGVDCTQRLNGQWAFAIWDRPKRTLFLSRDRLGVRPLFYTVAGGTFIFASEVKALFAHPAVKREMDWAALGQLFTFWFTLPPRTIFRDVYELPPGHSLTLQDGQLRVFAHWQVDFSRRLPVTADSSECEEEYEEQLSELLRDATRLRLRSDVPVGAYLSGGLDSTVVTALIRQCTDAHLKTFSVTFDDGEFDESAYQKEAVHHLATEHQEVRCSYGQIAGLLPDVIWHTEKPILRTAPVPLFLLSQLVRASGYKVVLTGEGSDEILGGYDIYKEAKVRRFLAAQPESRMRPLLLNRLYPYMDALSRQPDSYRRTFFRARPEELLDPFFSHLPRWDLTSKLKMFFSSEVKFELRASDAYTELRQLLPARYGSWDSFCRAQYLETALLLPGYILSSQGDRVAMAHSVEGRYPFLDHRLVEFAAQLPTQTKMKALNEKYLLKRMAKGLVPENIRKRSKQPYRAPDARSFFDSGTQSARAAYIDELLSPERIQRDGIFDPAAVGKLVAKAKRGETVGIKDNMAVVGILSTQLVFDQFIRNFGEKVDYASN